MSADVEQTVLRIRDLYKDYHEPTGVLHVLKGLSLNARRGEILLVMGPSGSGKTTMLQIAGCLVRQTKGTVEIAGIDVSHHNEAQRLRVRRRHLGYVFQAFHLVEALNVYDNIALGLRLRRLPLKKNHVFDILDRLGIASKAKKLPRDLSGGEKQRVAIARGLVGAPDILLADEPTTQLDSKSADIVCELLREAVNQYKPTVIITTHDARLKRIADRQLTLQDGVIHG